MTDDFPTTTAEAFSHAALSSTAPEPWSEADLASMLAHQLATPLKTDLLRFLPNAGSRIDALTQSAVPSITTFRDLFFHQHPPLDLLIFVKEFAKSAGTQPQLAPPAPLATLLYLLSIALALKHHNKRISSLSNADVKSQLQRASNQPWASRDVIELLASLLPLVPDSAISDDR